MSEKFEELNIFPYQKLIQSINYFFPRKEGATDIFSMGNLKKTARYAPYLGFFILLIMVVSFLRSCLMVAPQMNSPDHIIARFMAYAAVDFFLSISALFQYCRWLFYAVLAKIAKRSPDVPLVLSFFFPLRLLGGLCVFHIVIFSAVWLYNCIE